MNRWITFDAKMSYDSRVYFIKVKYKVTRICYDIFKEKFGLIGYFC